MRYRNLALFAVLSVVWGSAFTAIKAGLAYFPPILFAAVRYDVAGVLMLGYAVAVADRWRPRTRAEWRLVGVGALFMIGGYHALLFVGEQYTTSAAAAVVVGLSPVATTAFARVLLPDEKLSAVGVLGVLVGFAGVVVLARPDPGNLFGGDAVGEWLVFGAALSFALGSVLARRSDADLPVETMEAWSMLGGAAAMHAASYAVGERVADVRLVPEAVVALAYLAVVASALGFLVYFDLLDRLGPVEINLVSYAAPVAAAVTGVLVLGEVPTAWTAAGFLAVCCSFVLVKRDAVAREVASLRVRRRP